MYTVTFCLFIVDKLCDSRVFTAYCTALCILWELYLSELHFKCVISKQIACEKVSNTKDILDSFHCLKASDEQLPAQIKPENLQDYLGMVEYTRDKYQGNDYAGVVTGLAWTAVGGEILFVETSLSKGKGGKLTLTGNLGDVMKESAMLALEYIHAHAALFDIPEDRFENWNVHVHVPEGAIPKDGPSAGITMVTSLVSAFKQCKVKKNLAMTGEITLRGKVLPVGGIREKILAAKRAGIEEIILCQENKKDIDEIKPEYLKGVTFHYVKDIKEVIQLALLDEKVESPLF